MAPGVLLTDWPEAHRGGEGRGVGGVRRGEEGEDLRVCSCSRGSGAGPELWAAFLWSCSGPWSDSPPIITQSDRVTGAACLSPVLNHSISARGGGTGGGGGGGGEDLEYLCSPKLRHEATLVQTIVCVVYFTHCAERLLTKHETTLQGPIHQNPCIASWLTHAPMCGWVRRNLVWFTYSGFLISSLSIRSSLSLSKE